MPITKEGSQSEKATYCMIPNILYLEVARFTQTVKRLVVAMCLEVGNA